MITQTEGKMTREGYRLTSVQFIAETEEELSKGLSIPAIKYAPLKYLAREGEIGWFSKCENLTKAEQELIGYMKRSVEQEMSLSIIVARSRNVMVSTARNFVAEYRARCIVKVFQQFIEINA